MAKAETHLYTFKAPENLEAYHVIVKYGSLMSHVFAFAEDGGSAVNAVIASIGVDSETLAEAQITAKRCRLIGPGVYSM